MISLIYNFGIQIILPELLWLHIISIITTMGKKKVSILGTENESALKEKKAVQKEQKKLREGKPQDTGDSTLPLQDTEVKAEKRSRLQK